MPKSRPPYAPEFRRRMVDLVRAGREPEELAKEFEPSAQAIRNWVKQADLDEGRREDGLTSAEREELRRLRRENRQLREEREILAKAAAWFARRPDRSRPRVRIRESQPGQAFGSMDVSAAGGLRQRLLCRVEAPSFQAWAVRRGAAGQDP